VIAMQYLHAQPCPATGKAGPLDPGKKNTLYSQAKTGWQFHGSLLVLKATASGRRSSQRGIEFRLLSPPEEEDRAYLVVLSQPIDQALTAGAQPNDCRQRGFVTLSAAAAAVAGKKRCPEAQGSLL
jgi:hypothetical protein